MHPFTGCHQLCAEGSDATSLKITHLETGMQESWSPADIYIKTCLSVPEVCLNWLCNYFPAELNITYFYTNQNEEQKTE